ncbi:MAG: hypothetical protein K2P62_05920 [Phocaeicola sp.]|nr:hypothetical protein [Phocaeicola sp.]
MKLGIYAASILLALFTSCSNEEDVYYYKFKEIRYSIEEGDGVQEYDTPMEIISVTRNFSTDQEIFSPQFDPYVKNHERYVFRCDSPEEFNPTVGYVHVPIPVSVDEGGIVLSEDLKEYSMTETEDMEDIARFPSYPVPPMTKLTLSGELTIKKTTLTYQAVFVRCPSGEEHIVKGKYIRFRPFDLRVTKTMERL